MAFDPKNYAPDVPYLNGTWVILNPDSPHYRDFDHCGESGCIIDNYLSIASCATWKRLTPSKRAEHVVQVLWSDGNTSGYHSYDLLPLDKEPVTVEHVSLGNGIVTIRGYGDYLERNLNFHIIKRGRMISARLVFDDAWRKKVLDSMQ